MQEKYPHNGQYQIPGKENGSRRIEGVGMKK
jgi:hypothetical protein